MNLNKIQGIILLISLSFSLMFAGRMNLTRESCSFPPGNFRRTGLFLDYYGFEGGLPEIVATSDGGSILIYQQNTTNKIRVVKMTSAGRLHWITSKKAALVNKRGGSKGISQTAARFFGVEIESRKTLYLFVEKNSTREIFLEKIDIETGKNLGSINMGEEGSQKSVKQVVKLDDDTIFGIGEVQSLSQESHRRIWAFSITPTESGNPLYHDIDAFKEFDAEVLAVASIEGTQRIAIALADRAYLKQVTIKIFDYDFKETASIPVTNPRLSGITRIQNIEWILENKYNNNELVIISEDHRVSILDLKKKTFKERLVLLDDSVVGVCLSHDKNRLIQIKKGEYSTIEEVDIETGCKIDPIQPEKGYNEVPIKIVRGIYPHTYWALEQAKPYGNIIIMKVEKIRDLSEEISCNSQTSYYSYLYKNCFKVLTSHCHPLCSSSQCLLEDSPEHCLPKPGANDSVNILTSARPIVKGQYITPKSNNRANIITSPLCHPLCGGMCISLNNSSACAGYCGHSDPLIDDSLGYLGICNLRIAQLQPLITTMQKRINQELTFKRRLVTCADICGGSGCEDNNPNLCVSCPSVTGMTNSSTTKDNIMYYTCTCSNGGTFSSGKCVISSTSCHKYCAGKCTKLVDSAFCAGNPSNISCTGPTEKKDYSCTKCASNYIETKSGCLEIIKTNCDLRCSATEGCTSSNNNEACVSCSSLYGVASTIDFYPTKCECQSGNWTNGACTITIGCHWLCKGACTAAGSSSNCAQNTEGRICTKNTNSGDYTCTSCDIGYYSTGSDCLKILTSDCDPMCSSLGCTAIKDSNACMGCKEITNMVTTSGNTPYNCKCSKGEYKDGYCMLETNCHKYCAGKCTMPTSPNNCAQALAGTICTKNETTGDYKCTGCSENYVLTSQKCEQIIKNSCDPACNPDSGCTKPNNNTACVECRKARSITPLSTYDPIKCSCSTGELVNGQCIFTSNCHPLCQNKCTLANSEKYCATSPEGTLCTQNIDNEDYSCSGCKEGYFYGVNGCSLIVKNSTCSSACSLTEGCIYPYTASSCMGCSKVLNMKQLNNILPYTCECSSGTSLYNGLCKLDSSLCHPNCKGNCTKENDYNYCAQKMPGFDCTQNQLTLDYSCKICSTNYVMTKDNECLLILIGSSCDKRCSSTKGCTKFSDNNACVECSTLTGVVSKTGYYPIQCSCSTGSFDESRCLITSECHPLCAGKCTVKNNPLYCTQKPAGTICTQTLDTLEYSCTGCDTNYTLTSKKCEPILFSNCNSNCLASKGCTRPNDLTACVDCLGVTGMLSNKSYDPLKCYCDTGRTLEEGKCQLSTGCDPICAGKCTMPNNSSSCAHAADGAICTASTMGNFVCASCKSTHVLTSRKCEEILNTGCAQQCDSSKGCTKAGDNTACVDCPSITGMLKEPGYPYSCSCKQGSQFKDGYCLITDSSTCHPICAGNCTEVNKKNNCVYKPPNTECTQNSTTKDWICSSCSNNYVLTSRYCEQIKTLNCHENCLASSWCTKEADYTACIECPSITGMLKETGYPYSCSCKQGSHFKDGYCLITDTSSCHPICSGNCTETKNINNCVYKPPGTECTQNSTTKDWICSSCSSNYVLTSRYCEQIKTLNCHENCLASSGCTKEADYAACVECPSITGMAKTSGYPYTCACNNGGAYTNKYCLIKTGCHALCGGNCTMPNDKKYCAHKPEGTSCTLNETTGDWSCIGCSDGYVFVNDKCVKILYSNCHNLCLPSDGCTVANNNQACISCPTITGMNTDPNFFPKKCYCDDGSTYDGSYCLRNSGCAKICEGKCTKENDCQFCAQSPTGAICTKNTKTGDYSCSACATNYVMNSIKCVPIIKDGSCDNRCSSEGCTEISSNSACVSCKSLTGLATTTDFDPVKCNCTTGTWDGSHCTLNINCHPLCAGKCTLANNNGYCTENPQGTSCTLNQQTGDYNCLKCSTGYALTRTKCTEIKQSSSCNILCSSEGCTALTVNTACVSCALYTGVVSDNNYDPYMCSCGEGRTLEGAYCIYTEGCHAICDNKCTIKNNPSFCAQEPVGASCIKNAITNDYECSKCKENYALTREKCTSILISSSCHENCDQTSGCTKTNDYNACVNCPSITNMVKESGKDPYSCTCASGTTYKNGYCLLDDVNSCHKICEKQCTVANDPNHCAQNPKGAQCTKNAISGDYACTQCAEGYVMTTEKCTLVLKSSSCDSRCSDTFGCTRFNDPTACVACKSLTGLTQISGSDPYKCECKTGTYNGEYCLITSNCHPYCAGKCTEENNSAKCAQNAVGAECSKVPSTGDYSCTGCSSGYVKTIEKCAEILLSSECHPACSSSGCTKLNDNSACVRCLSVTGMNEVDNYYPKSCSCNSGSTLNKGLCLLDDPALCHFFCEGKCTKQGNPNYCGQNPEGVNCELNTQTKDYVCTSCKENYSQTREKCAKIIISDTNCDTLCKPGKGCTQIGNNLACVECAAITNINSIPGFDPMKCECAQGTSLLNKHCAYTDGCDKHCDGLCTIKGDYNYCAQEPEGSLCKINSLTGDFICETCKSNYVMTRERCTKILENSDQCHDHCLKSAGCTLANSNSSCVECKPITGMQADPNFDPKKCECKNGGTYTNGYCLLTTGCHGYCDEKCTVANDPAHCAQKPSAAKCQQNLTTGDYNCTECEESFVLTRRRCRLIFKSESCHSMCDATNGCTAILDPFSCITCKQITGLISTSNYDPVKCECQSGTVYENGYCMIKQNCHLYCDGQCTKENDPNYCAQNAAGTVCSQDSISKNYICSGCANGWVLTKNKCEKLIDDSTKCHPTCNSADGCTHENDNTACVSCKSVTNMNTISGFFPKSCVCTDGVFQDGYCLITVDCHPYCAGNCTVKNSASNCAKNVEGTVCKKNETTGDYTCSECMNGYVLTVDKCEKKIEDTSLCHSSCYKTDGCTREKDSKACVSCRKYTSMLSNTGFYPLSCSCISGTYTDGFCMETKGCHPYCAEKCTVPGNSSHCAQQIDGTNCIQDVISGDYICTSCSNNYTLTKDKCEKILDTSELCHSTCDEAKRCTKASDSTACVACKSYTNLISTAGFYPYNCACNANTIYEDNHCIIADGSKNCHPICDGKCTVPNSNKNCSKKAEGADCTFDPISGDYSCPTCTENYILTINKCEKLIDSPSQCHDSCNKNKGCTKINDNTTCVECIHYTNMKQESNYYPNRCICVNGIFENGRCIFTSGCHPYCDGKCTVINNPANCAQNPIGTKCSLNSATGDYSCTECNENYTLTKDKCEHILDDATQCHGSCNPDKRCTRANDPTACVECKPLTNLKSEINYYPVRCTCEYGTFKNNYCMFETGCDPLCDGKCTKQNNKLYCAQSTLGTECTQNSLTKDFQCTSCSVGYVLTRSRCVKIITDSTCHTSCDSTQGCTLANSNSSCVDCSKFTGITKMPNYDPYLCDCSIGTTYNNNRCVISSDCHIYCGGLCTKASDANYCAQQLPGTICSQTSSGDYTCTGCEPSYIITKSGCTKIISDSSCSANCLQTAGCTKANDDTACIKCQNITGMNDVFDQFLHTCQCSNSGKYIDGHCQITEDCHPLCAGKCTKKKDKDYCATSASGTICVLSTYGDYSCSDCQNGFALTSTQCKEIIKNETCHDYCNKNVGCTEKGSSTACLECKKIYGMKSMEGFDPLKCYCETGTYTDGYCLITKNCHPLCGGKCTKENDAAYCAQKGEGTNCIGPDTYGNYNCTNCLSNYVLTTTQCKIILKSSNCDLGCSVEDGCTMENSPTSCVKCKSITNMKTEDNYDPKKCYCDGVTSYWNSNGGYCIINTGCHPLCGDKCTKQNNENYCAQNLTGTICQQNSNTGDFACSKCVEGYSLTRNQCKKIIKDPSKCSQLCSESDGCTLENSDISCVKCKTITGLTEDNKYDPVKCSCANGGVYNEGYCLITEGCHALCGGKCTKKADSNNCAQNLTGTICNINPTTKDYACSSCSPGYSLTSTKCALILNESCHSHCQPNLGCTEANKNDSCIKCKTITGMKEVSGYNPYNCYCDNGGIYTNGYCLITEGCDSICGGKCTKKSDSQYCAQNLEGTTCTLNTITNDYNCTGCKSGYILTTKGCMNIITSSSCDSGCNPSDGCTSISSLTSCVKCKPITNMISESGYDLFKCYCGYESKYSEGYCMLTENCHILCDKKCTKANNANFCAQNVTGAVCIQNSTTLDFSCSKCQSGYVLTREKCMPIITNTSCHENCDSSGCTREKDNTACLNCPPITGMEVQANYDPKYCFCKTGTYKNGYCLLTENCHDICEGKCTVINDFNFCAQQPIGAICTQNSTTKDYSCKECKTGYVLTSKGCIPFYKIRCADTCSSEGCTVQDSNTNCLTCKKITNMNSETQRGVYFNTKCTCGSGSTYVDGLCVYYKNCHKHCNGICTKQNDPLHCAYPLEGGDCTQLATLDYSCPKCLTGKSYSEDTNMCVDVISNKCYSLCNKCTAISSATSCNECLPGDNIITTQGYSVVKCECAPDTFLLTNNICGYTDGCHGNCNGLCSLRNRKDRCQGCIPHMAGELQSDRTYICEFCDLGYVLDQYICKAILKSNCHDLCDNGECVVENDYKSCKSCRSNSPSNVATANGGVYSCTCQSGTFVNNSRCEVTDKARCGNLCLNGCLAPNDNNLCLGGCIQVQNIVKKSSSKNYSDTYECSIGTYSVIIEKIGVNNESCKGFSYTSTINPENLRENSTYLWEIKYLYNPSGLPSFISDLKNINTVNQNLTIPHTSLNPGGKIEIKLTVRNANGFYSSSTLTVDIGPSKDTKNYCGPCQFNDREICQKLNNFCWTNYLNVNDSIKLSNENCLITAAKYCYQIWSATSLDDPQCIEFNASLNLTKMKNTLNVSSAKYEISDKETSIIINFSAAVRISNIQSCSGVVTKATLDCLEAGGNKTIAEGKVSKTGNPSCRWIDSSTFKIAYTPNPSLKLLSSVSLRGDTIYSSYAYAQIPMTECDLSLAISNPTYTLSLLSPSAVNNLMPLTLSAAVSPNGYQNWQFIWSITYSSTGSASDNEKKSAESYFASIKNSTEKQLKVLSIPSLYLYKNGILSVSVTAKGLSTGDQLSKTATIYINDSAGVSISDLSIYTGRLYGNNRNRIELNIASGSNIAVTFEVYSGSTSDNTTTKEESLANYLSKTYSSIKAIIITAQDKKFQYYTYYKIIVTVTATSSSTNSKSSDSFIAYLIQQPPECKASISYIVNPQQDNTLSSLESKKDSYQGADVSYLWTCDECKLLVNDNSCSCEVWRSPNDKMAANGFLYKGLMVDQAKYIFTLTVSVIRNGNPSSCSCSVEFITLSQAKSSSSPKVLKSLPGNNKGYIIYLGLNIENSENIKSSQWELIEYEDLLKSGSNSSTSKYSKKSAYIKQALEESYGIKLSRRLLADKTSKSSQGNTIPENIIPPVVSISQSNPPLIGIPSNALADQTIYSYAVNVSFKDSSGSLMSIVSYVTPPGIQPKELSIAPESGTEYKTLFTFSFYSPNADNNNEESFQLFRKDCPNSPESETIPFTMKMKNLNSISTILASGPSSCNNAVQIILKATSEANQNKEILVNKTITISSNNDKESKVKELLSQLETSLGNSNSISGFAQTWSTLHQLAYFCPYADNDTITKFIKIISLYDSGEQWNAIINTFDDSEVIGFLMHCVEILKMVLKGGPKKISKEVLDSILGKAWNYWKIFKNSASGSGYIINIIGLLDSIASLNDTKSLITSKISANISSLINEIIDSKLLDLIPGADPYELLTTNIGISMKAINFASNFSSGITIKIQNQSFSFSPGLKMIFSNDTQRKCNPSSCILTMAFTSYTFNPYPSIKGNAIIDTNYLTNESLAGGLLYNSTIRRIYADLRNTSLLDSVIDKTYTPSRIIQMSLHTSSFDSASLKGKEIIVGNITFDALSSNQELSSEVTILNDWQSEFSPRIPVYYVAAANNTWSNKGCYLYNNGSGRENVSSMLKPSNYWTKPLIKCSLIESFNQSIIPRSAIILTVDAFSNINDALAIGKYQSVLKPNITGCTECNKGPEALFFLILGFVILGIILAIIFEYNSTFKYYTKEALKNLSIPQGFEGERLLRENNTGFMSRLARFFVNLRLKGYLAQTYLHRMINTEDQNDNSISAITPRSQIYNLGNNTEEAKGEGDGSPNRMIRTRTTNTHGIYSDNPTINYFNSVLNEKEITDLNYLQKKQVTVHESAERDPYLKEFEGEIMSSKEATLVTSIYLDQKECSLRTTYWGSLKAEHSLLSLIYVTSILAPRWIRFLLFGLTYLGEIFMVSFFFNSKDKIASSDDPASTGRIFAAGVASIAIMGIFKTIFYSFLVYKCPHPYLSKRQREDIKTFRNWLIRLLGLIALSFFYIVCIMRIIKLTNDSCGAFGEKWIYSYLVCLFSELVLVDFIKMNLKMLLNKFFMWIAKKKQTTSKCCSCLLQLIDHLYFNLM